MFYFVYHLVRDLLPTQFFYSYVQRYFTYQHYAAHFTVEL